MATQEARTILLAIDGSENSKYAFEWMVSNLYHASDKIVLCHIPEAPKLPTFSFKDGLALPASEWQKTLQEQIEKTTKLHNDYEQDLIHKKIKYTVVGQNMKNPGEGIIMYAKNENASMIVMGTRGQTAIRRTFMGSVSDYVVHHAACPVVVVPKSS